MDLTYSEIKQQYPALERTLAYINSQSGAVQKLFEQRQPSKIIYLGCGSSFNIAESLAITTQMLLKLPSSAIPAGELMLHMDRYAGYLAGSLFVTISRSGSTSELVNAIREVKTRLNSSVVSIICVTGSELAGLSDINLEMPWAFDHSVCQTRTVTCMYAAGMLLIAKLAGEASLEKDLYRAAELGPAYMERYEPLFKKIAEGTWENVTVLADAELAGIAAEGALAFKEISQLPSNYYHLLDSRHGPFVMIRENTQVIAALSNPESPYEKALVNNLVKRGATVVCFSDTTVNDLDGPVIQVSFGEPLQHAARGIPFILIPQMTAYFKAVRNGVNPDAPEGLDAWIKL